MTNLVVEPSRFDKANNKLLCSIAGQWLQGMVARHDPAYNIVPYDKLSSAPPADHWLLLGKNPTLNSIGAAHEGYTYQYRGARAIPTFDAQVANDFATEEDEEDDEQHHDEEDEEDVSELEAAKLLEKMRIAEEDEDFDKALASSSINSLILLLMSGWFKISRRMA